MEQEGKIMEEFVQEFRRAAKESEYERRPLVEEFKREMNGAIRRKLIEAKRPLTSIKQQYKCATNLDKYWRENKKKEERLRERQEIGAQASRLNNMEILQQQMPQPQVWLRRQEIPQQQVLIELALMERVERTNVVVTRNQERPMGPLKKDPYMINVDKGRNCYTCGRFGHLARNCRNKRMKNRIRKGRRLEYRQRKMIEGGNEDNNNLNGN